MGKRKVFTEDGQEPKRRRRSIISSDSTNPHDEDGLAQCFHVVSATMHVSIAPVFIEDAKAGIRRQHLDPLLMTYNSDFEGVVVSHLDLEILGQDEAGGPAVAKIMNDSPFSYTWVKSNFLVWSPRKGDLLEGFVSLQSPSHIALLVHDTFNASIKREDIPETWTFEHFQDDENDSKSLGYWLDQDGNRIGGKLLFNVKRFNVSGRTVLIHGSLLTVKDVQLPRITEVKEDGSAIEDNEEEVNGQVDEEAKINEKPSGQPAQDAQLYAYDSNESEDDSE